ncbi:MAG: NrfD/PsrC family molybdoenzyme membrane anchor subunit [Betaproteobacteria bacterium]
MAAIPASMAHRDRGGLAVALIALVLLAGLGAAYYMEEHGHVVSGMNNQVVWGLPHVFAFFLIVSASGALNVASIASVFGEKAYKPLAPLSVLMAVALLAGGLMILVLDLGRPERLLVAVTNYNFRSIFAWNMQLYTGLFAIGALYLWVLLERRFNRFARPVGMLAFAWRVVLTTATGSVLGFLVARQAFGTAVLAPLFIALSLAWGLAAFWIGQVALARGPVDDAFARRIGRLLGLFLIVVLWLVAVYHGTNLYWARQDAFERFILVDGAPYAQLFWGGFVLVGCAVPLALVYHPRLASPRSTLLACALAIVGAIAFVYVLLIGAQAYPMEIFPGYAARSDFGDGRIDPYVPRLPELLLGLGGIAAAALITVIGTRVFPILPREGR